MKKITYKERATFYIQEVNKDYKKIKLLKTIKKKYFRSNLLKGDALASQK